MNRQYLIVFFAVFALFSLFSTDLLQAEEHKNSQWLKDHFRLVWLQDYGDGRDVLAMGRNLVLYGYDSRDGKGERRLIHKRGSFYLPLFTPDGQSVIFSDRKARKMFLLDWQSGHIKELGDGVAVEVWLDTERRFFIGKPRVWVYCFSGPQREHKNGTRQPLYRFPLDNPKKKELVWNKTIVAWSNLQLSRDGEAIGGLFPWPHGGILWQKDKRWQRFGRGCWTSLSPDNSKLLWIFDGLHRNVQVYDVINGKNWKVNINDAPGINGFEVYHPRWSNHPRYFTVTGPYEKGEGGNKIGGGGEKVEIYIGRFDNKVKRVENWLKVTDNSRADFFPELWIENGEKARLTDEISGNTRAGPKTVEKSSWPVSPGRLIFIWDNMKAPNQLGDNSPVGFFQSTINLKGKALHTRNFQLAIWEGWGDTGDAGPKIGQALEKSKQAAIEFTLTPEPNQQGTILLFSGNKKRVLSMEQDKVNFRLVSTSGSSGVVWEKVFKNRTPLHLSLNIDEKSAELFVNGKSRGKKKLGIDLTARPIDTFSVGDFDGGWSGIIEKIGIYDQQLSRKQVGKNSSLIGRDIKADDVEMLLIEGSLLETTEIPAPESIGAYSRALVVNTYKVDKIIDGKYGEDRILVAEWAVLDRQIIRTYGQEREQLTLEKFSDHPELEGERQMMDLFEPDLEMYYRLPWKAQ